MQNTHLKKFVVVFVISFLMGIGITVAYVKNKSAVEYSMMTQLVGTRANKIGVVITKLLYKTQALAALVIQNNGDVTGFERVAANIIDDPAILNVILAPDGVVSAVYPLEGNEAVLGLNYFSEGAGNAEARTARDSRQLVLGGPFKLVQGGEALVGRLPVYVDDKSGTKKFWGLVSVTLRYPDALFGAELYQLRDMGLAFEIWRISPDTGERQVIANSSYEYNSSAPYVEQPVRILNAEWFFRLSPIREWYQFPETWIFVFITVLVSLLVARLVRHNDELKGIRAELEWLSFSDALTDAINRRGLMVKLEEVMRRRNTEFVLCYIDLNKFKSINDIYGHIIGDKVLRKFADIVRAHKSRDSILARIGGDEFVIIFMNTCNRDVVVDFFASIKDDFIQAVQVEEGFNIDISFSLGISVYPLDGKTTDELLNAADNDMYIAKNKRG